jgi:uncharacterized SAM-binding protein YcdF (DUF218 family)
LLFVLSKIFWRLVEPDLLLVAVVALGLALGATRRWARAGIRVAASGTLLLLAIAFLPTDAWLLGPLEGRFPPMRDVPAQIDGIIALGGAIDAERTAAHGIPSLNDDAERVTTFVTLARLYPTAKLVFTSGSASVFADHPREADAAKQLFADLGLDTTKIIFERESRNTYENAIFSKPLADPKPGENWILITSAWHMPRAVGVFRRAGWPVLPWPVAYKTGSSYDPSLALHLLDVERAVHEWLGLVAYRLLDRTDALFPAP